jgi:hypothetical protein
MTAATKLKGVIEDVRGPINLFSFWDILKLNPGHSACTQRLRFLCHQARQVCPQPEARPVQPISAENGAQVRESISHGNQWCLELRWEVQGKFKVAEILNSRKLTSEFLVPFSMSGSKKTPLPEDKTASAVFVSR